MHQSLNIFLLIVFLCPSILKSQSIGLETGLAGIENFDFPEFDAGVSVFLPVNDKMLLNLAYYKWSGEDGNYDTENKDSYVNIVLINSQYYGNEGVDLSILYNIFSKRELSTYLGIGLGSYKMISVSYADCNELKIDEETSINISTIPLTLLLKYNISDKVSLYYKNVIVFDHLAVRPDRGLFNIGLEFNPFKLF